MRAIISAGGTGGHIYPALAIINKIKECDSKCDILYIGTHNRMEKDIVPKQNIPYEQIEMYGFNRKKPLKNFKTISCLYKSYKKCLKIIQEFKPDVVIGVGGYVTVPVILAAHKLHVKIFIHEQNSIAGASNKFLSKYANLIGVSFKSSMKDFKGQKAIFTGNPCSEEALKANPCNKREFGLDEHKKLVLLVMGSLGSSKINEFLIKTIDLFKNKEYEVLFVTGQDNYEQIKTRHFPSNVKCVAYIDNMSRLLKKTDLIVSRAGASTLSEIIALNIPSILIPSPYVANNHQYLNALDLTSSKAAILINEADLKGDILVQTIDNIIFNKQKIREIKTNLERFKVPNSATIIYENIKKLVDGEV